MANDAPTRSVCVWLIRPTSTCGERPVLCQDYGIGTGQPEWFDVVVKVLANDATWSDQCNVIKVGGEME